LLLIPLIKRAEVRPQSSGILLCTGKRDLNGLAFIEYVDLHGQAASQRSAIYS